MQAWYVQYKDALIGPISEKEVIKKVTQGDVPSNAYVCLEGDTEWYLATDLSVFSEYFSGEQMDMEVELVPERHWVVLSAGKSGDYEQDGPYASREILSMIAKGDLDYSDRVWRPGQQTWERIGELDSFVPASLNESALDKKNETAAVNPLLSSDSNEDFMNSVASFEGRDILEHALNTMPAEVDGEDLTRSQAPRFQRDLSPDEILQMSFPLENKKAGASTVSETVTKKWIPVPQQIRGIAKGLKINLSQVFAVGFLLLLVGFLMKHFIVIEPTTRLEATEKTVSEFKKPSLRIYGVALSSMRPRLELRSNYDREDQLNIEIQGREGRILNNFRFSKSMEAAFLPGESVEIKLSDLQLADGLYVVRASLGNLKSEKEVFIGVDDIQFESKLKQFNSQKKKRSLLEAKILKSVGQDLELRAAELLKTLKKKNLSKLEWQSFYNSWKRKFYESAHSELRSFSPDTSGKFVKVDQFSDLKKVRLDLWKASKDISPRSPKNSVRSISELEKRIRSL